MSEMNCPFLLYFVALCSTHNEIQLHPSSVMMANEESLFPTDWIIYDEMIVQDQKRVIKGCTSVTAATVVLFAGEFLKNISPTRTRGERSDSNFVCYICIFYS